jgi:hypothetical protein
MAASLLIMKFYTLTPEVARLMCQQQLGESGVQPFKVGSRPGLASSLSLLCLCASVPAWEGSQP